MAGAFRREIGGKELLRPRREIECSFRDSAEQHLRERYVSGAYTDGSKINEILQCQFEYFNGTLAATIGQIASVNLLECILSQYDVTSTIEYKSKCGELTAGEQFYWYENGPVIRRSLKYIAELVSLNCQVKSAVLADSALLLALESILISAEMMVHLYMLSDQTYGLHPDQTIFTIHPEGGNTYWELEVANPEWVDNFAKRCRLDTQLRSDLISSRPPNVDDAFQGQILDPVCAVELGFSYTAALGILRNVVDSTIAHANSSDIPFLNRSYLIDSLAADLGYDQSVLGRLVDGFTVNSESTTSELRRLWKPKQEYRAYRRGFFEVPHHSGAHLMWSRAMARECLLLLKDGTVYQHFPSEWKTVRMRTALGSLQNSAGKWFEQELAQHLSLLGVEGRPCVKHEIGQGDFRITIPPFVGELDYLGYIASEELLVLLECKMTDSAHEPSLVRDDVSRFVTNDRSYVKQLACKREWVKRNFSDIARALSAERSDGAEVRPGKLATALITLYPTYASYFISDFPCVALSEFVTDYMEHGIWPYNAGVDTLQ